MKMPIQAPAVQRQNHARAASVSKANMVGPAGILDDIGGFISDAIGFIEDNPWVLAPLILL
jgi:hypothetical protein